MAVDRTRVLVVDDSAVIRQLLSEILSRDPEIEVVGGAADPYVARTKIKRLKPDVLTLDVEMPRMDGLTFLRNLMRLHPLPVVMVSSMTQAGAETTLEALALGAVDFIAKPQGNGSLADYSDELIAKVKAAARARPTLLEPRCPPIPPRCAGLSNPIRGDGLIAIGASTGGTEAIREVLARLPANMPAVVVAQHIPAMFSAPFARRLDQHCALRVHEARDGEEILPGHVYVAPGNYHLVVTGGGGRYRCRLDASAPVNRHRPSVDVLFRSVARAAGRHALGVILTGMGTDGAQGLLEMRQAGALTLAQDEKTSVVWGMPGAAVRLDAAASVLPLERISGALLQWVRDYCRK